MEKEKLYDFFHFAPQAQDSDEISLVEGEVLELIREGRPSKIHACIRYPNLIFHISFFFFIFQDLPKFDFPNTYMSFLPKSITKY